MGNNKSRDDFASGPWDPDLDKHPGPPGTMWWFEYKGYHCEIERGKMWVYSGFVKLPNNHPDYSEEWKIFKPDQNFRSLYGEHGRFGFDCWMDGDMRPILKIMLAIDPNSFDMYADAHYWTYEDVEEQLKRLVDLFIERDSHNNEESVDYVGLDQINENIDAMEI